jgi:hypothetical protein
MGIGLFTADFVFEIRRSYIFFAESIFHVKEKE